MTIHSFREHCTFQPVVYRTPCAPCSAADCCFCADQYNLSGQSWVVSTGILLFQSALGNADTLLLLFRMLHSFLLLLIPLFHQNLYPLLLCGNNIETSKIDYKLLHNAQNGLIRVTTFFGNLPYGQKNYSPPNFRPTPQYVRDFGPSRSNCCDVK